MDELVRFETDKSLNYLKARKAFIKMFQPYVNTPIEQLPMVIDVMSLFVAGLDGNGFYGHVGQDGIHHHQQYDDVSLEVLTLGIEAYMTKHNIPKKVKKEYNWPLAHGFGDTVRRLKELRKQLSVYTKKKKAEHVKFIKKLASENDK